MKKIVVSSFVALILFFGWGLFTQSTQTTEADWWVRPTEREIQPTRPPRVTLAPRIPPEDIISPMPSPTSVPGGGTIPSGGTSEDNPCGPGKSYTGPNCGWSPGIEEYDHDSGSGGSGGNSSGISGYGTGGPEILGLSNTSSTAHIDIVDILQLLGILCLLVYVKSKLGITINSKR